MMHDQRGFLEAPGFVLLVVLSALLGTQAVIWHLRLKQTREHHRQVLCLKNAIGVTSRMMKQVHGINVMLAAGKVGQGIGLFFPGAGWLLALEWEKAKKVLMKLQEAAWLRAQQLLLKDRLAGCRLPPQVHQTPLKHGALLERKLDVTVLRRESETWILQTPLMSFHAKWNADSPLKPLAWDVR
jgi:hypothetical protein